MVYMQLSKRMYSFQQQHWVVHSLSSVWLWRWYTVAGKRVCKHTEQRQILLASFQHRDGLFVCKITVLVVFSSAYIIKALQARHRFSRHSYYYNRWPWWRATVTVSTGGLAVIADVTSTTGGVMLHRYSWLHLKVTAVINISELIHLALVRV
jgi:hypothetical protein